jgi:antigen flippase
LSGTGKNTYGQILKSSAVIGGSSLLNVGLGIVRTKAMALMLGPAGVGLLGLYSQVSELFRTVAGLGINSSGVRQIAEAVGSGDTQRIARTVTTLRRVAVCSGALGGLLVLALCKPVAWLSFGNGQNVVSIALLSFVVFFGDVSAGQSALVQGMRRIGDLARMSVLGALYGTLFSIPIVYYYYRQGAAEKGVVPSLICVAAMAILTSWWYARKIRVERVPLTLRQVAGETSALLKLGVVLMASGLMTMGVTYLVRVIVLRKIGLDAAGLYQSAWQLGGFYIGFVLQAMGADFYPRLTAVANNNLECNRLVNEQSEVGLLLAGPGVLATLTFAPLIIHLFYSAKFEPAVEVLRWICLGMMLRVASWPMGFILLAKGEGKIFFWTELFSNLLFVGLAWIGVLAYGLNGVGLAFFCLYLAYWLGIYAVARRVSGFRWSAANRHLGLLFAPVVIAVFVGWYFLPRPAEMVFGSALTLLTGIYSLKILCTLIPLTKFPPSVQKLFRLFRLAPTKARVENDP